jgi:hypothetical protein
LAGERDFENLFPGLFVYDFAAIIQDSSSENQLVVPPLGGSVGCRSIPWSQTLAA